MTTSSRHFVFAMICFGLLVLIGQVWTYFLLESKSKNLLNQKVDAIVARAIDTTMLNKQSLAAEKLELRFQALKEDIADVEQNLKKDYYVFAGIGLPLSLLALIGYFWSVFVYLKKQAEDQVKAQIAPIVQQNESLILDVLEKHDDERRLFATKKIRITGEKKLDNIRAVLQVIGFNLQHLITDEDVKEGESYDVVFINNAQGEFFPKEANTDQRKALRSILEKQAKNICFFYYNETLVHVKTNELAQELADPSLPAKFNFASNPAQIYNNLLNTLKYQDKLSSS